MLFLVNKRPVGRHRFEGDIFVFPDLFPRNDDWPDFCRPCTRRTRFTQNDKCSRLIQYVGRNY